MAIHMTQVSESEKIAAVAIGVLGNTTAQHTALSHATLPALIGAKLHISPVDIYALTILDCYISAAKKAQNVK